MAFNSRQWLLLAIAVLVVGVAVLIVSAVTRAPSPTDSDTASSPSTYSDCGSESACSEDYEKYCAAGLESADWVAWAEERGYKSGSKKYARTSCLDAQGDALTDACRAFQDCHNGLNDELTEKCGKYAKQGEVCAGITPTPGQAPLEDCLALHQDELDAVCLDAYTRHAANRL